MNQEEITALAREYAEWVTEDYGEHNAYIPGTQATTAIFLRWLCKRYCLVRKENPANLLSMVSNGEYNAKFAEGVETTIGLLFPDLGKEVEE